MPLLPVVLCPSILKSFLPSTETVSGTSFTLTCFGIRDDSHGT